MTHTEILRNYYLNARTFSNKFTVRPGYYLITNEFIASNDNRTLVKAYYHPSCAFFYTECLFIINLKPLYNYYSISKTKGIPVEHLVNGIIKIDSIELVESTFNNQPTTSYQVSWELIDYAPASGMLKKSLDNQSPATQNQNTKPDVSLKSEVTKNIENDNPDCETDSAYDPEEENELLQLVYDEFIQTSNQQLEEDQLLFDQCRAKEIEDEKLN